MEGVIWIVGISCNTVTGCRSVHGDIWRWWGDSNKKDGSFLCDGELWLKCGVASNKRICIPEVCVSRDDKGDAAGGEFVENDEIFIFGSLILFLFIVENSYLLSWSY